EAASELYFGRPASALSTGQAALLAGLAGSPDRFDPFRHPEAARARMEQVLARMRRAGAIDAEDMRIARAAPLDLVSRRAAFEDPHLVSWLSGSLPALGLDRAVRVETTIDPALQHDVEEGLREEIEGLRDRRVTNAAAIVIDNASGEILAYAGSVDFLDDDHGGQNDGVRAMRQPGSALKPFAYGLGIARGRTPGDLLPDVETHLSTASGDYVPKNYDRRVHGPVRLREALANSYNVPAVRLADDLGPDQVLGLLRTAGFESLTGDPSDYGVGIVLGDGDVSLRELARAYRGLALGGVVAPITEVRAAWDAAGAPIAIAPEMRARRFLPRDAVALVTDIISDEGARAPAFGLDNALRLPFPVAAKTGTSRAYVDNWCVGFTHERTVAVWVGNFDGKPMVRVSGITGAGPIFKRVMTRAMRGIRPAPLVDRARFEKARICALSGRLAGAHCPSTIDEVYLPGSAPKDFCPMHREGKDGRAVVDVGPEFYGWAAGEGLDDGPWPGGGAAGTAGKLLQPADGDEFLLEPGMPAGAQAIPVRALAPAGVTTLTLVADGARRELRAPFTTAVTATPGTHRMELWTPGGAAPIAVAEYRVKGGDP
ncbi:MAG TPA: penicillin-binding transpeptidase domain-containing protein, partial [bacterium]|nr:penicillin-binding transpeptidase domain-containing protein [bacterium]